MQPQDPPHLGIKEGLTWKMTNTVDTARESVINLWELHVQENEIECQLVIKSNNGTKPISQYMIKKRFSSNNAPPFEGHFREAFIQQTLVPDGTEAIEVYTVPVTIFETDSRPADDEQEPNAIMRLYMPYYAYGNLQELLMANTQAGKPLPEPFVWYLFFRLVKAAVVMDEKFRTPERDYTVVHLDITLDNIFFGDPGSLGINEDFAVYPPAYLGDFGIAEITYDGDPDANRMRNLGSSGYMAPEIWLNADGEVGLDVPPSSKTNIWQIGRVMLAVLEGQYDAHKDFRQPDWAAKANKGTDFRYKNICFAGLTDWAGPSRDIIHLVQCCLRFEASRRPTPQKLLLAIQKFMPRHVRGMDRWGTLDWFKQRELTPPRPEQAGDEEQSEELVTLKPLPKQAVDRGKRKADHDAADDDLPMKRVRTASVEGGAVLLSSTTEERMTLVANQLKWGILDTEDQIKAELNSDTLRFFLDQRFKMFYTNTHDLFDVCDFFSNPDPEPIKIHRLEAEDKAEFDRLVQSRTKRKNKSNADAVAKSRPTRLQLKVRKSVQDLISPQPSITPEPTVPVERRAQRSTEIRIERPELGAVVYKDDDPEFFAQLDAALRASLDEAPKEAAYSADAGKVKFKSGKQNVREIHRLQRDLRAKRRAERAAKREGKTPATTAGNLQAAAPAAPSWINKTDGNDD